jgi:hypothetical protein
MDTVEVILQTPLWKCSVNAERYDSQLAPKERDLDARGKQKSSKCLPWVPEKLLQAMTINNFSAVILVLVSSLLLSSCADLKLPPNQPASSRYRRPGSGDCTFRRGSELGFSA